MLSLVPTLKIIPYPRAGWRRIGLAILLTTNSSLWTTFNGSKTLGSQARPLCLLEGPPESTFAGAVTQPRRLIHPGFAPPYSLSSTLRGATCCSWNREPGLPPDLRVLDPSWLKGCERSFASFVFISWLGASQGAEKTPLILNSANISWTSAVALTTTLSDEELSHFINSQACFFF